MLGQALRSSRALGHRPGTRVHRGEFTKYLAELGCVHHTIDSQSPWQQGRTGRAGGSLKENLRDVVRDCGIVSI